MKIEMQSIGTIHTEFTEIEGMPFNQPVLKELRELLKSKKSLLMA